MDLLLYSAALLVFVVLIFISIERPYIVASLLVFIYVYRFFNIELPGPLDARGALTLILFARLFLFDKKNYLMVKRYFFRDLNGILFCIFLLLSSYITFSFYGGLVEQLRLSFLLLTSLILGFIIITNEEGQKAFFWGIVISGILCTMDLIFSAISYGSLRTRSLLNILLFGNYTDWNHNALGVICAFALLIVFISFVKKQITKKVAFILTLVLTLGLLLSTSRSALLAVILVSLIMFLVQKEIKLNPNKVFISFFGLFIFLISFYFIYNGLLKSGSIQSSLVDQTYYRLYEEPMSLFGGNEDKVFNKFGVEQEGNARWRMNRALSDLSKYTTLDLEIQLFGLGVQGYLYSNYGGDNASPHNGYVLILIERGITGLLIFILVIVNLSYRSFKLIRQNFINLPMIYILLALVFYTIGQNSELTNYIAFLIIGAVIGNTKEALVLEDETENNLGSSFLVNKI